MQSHSLPQLTRAVAVACILPAALKSVVKWDLAPLMVEGTTALVLGGLLGLPILLYFRRTRLLRSTSVVLAGIVIAVVPLGVLFYPADWAGTRATKTNDGATTMIEGQPTPEGWRQYTSGAVYRATYGALSAATLLLVLRVKSRSTKHASR
jgi:hypothetical protein